MLFYISAEIRCNGARAKGEIIANNYIFYNKKHMEINSYYRKTI